MKDKYKIDPGPIKYNTEETTAISKISYEIENAKLYGIKSKTIGRQIDQLKEAKKFPSNLEYVDSYTDSLNGVTTSAFLNKDTGKVTLGMTGTNIQGEAFKKLKEGEFSRQILPMLWKQLKMDMQILKYYILLHLIKTIDMRIRKNL